VKEPPPLQHQVFEEVAASSFSISEIIIRQPSHDHPTEEDMISNGHYAAPISIFANTMRPKGIIHWQITPKLVPLADTTTVTCADPRGPQSVVPGWISHNPAFSAPAPQPAPTVQGPPAGPFTATGAHPQVNIFGPIFGWHHLNAPQWQFGQPPLMTHAPFLNGATVPPAPGPHATAMSGGEDLDLTMTDQNEDLGPLTPHYRLPALRLAHYWFEENDQKPTVAAGADRSVFWTRPTDNRADFPPMRNLLAYSSQSPKSSRHHAGYPYAGSGSNFGPLASGGLDGDSWGILSACDDGSMAGDGDGGSMMGDTGGLDGPTNGPDDGRLKQLSLPIGFKEAVEQGTQSVTFDETSGKLCIVAGKPTKILLLDYAR
jgi:hypothetical protein